MRDENAKNPKRKLSLKIILPVLILCVIAGIWAVKQNNTVPGDESNPDFALNTVKTLDLEKLKSYQLPIIIEFGSDSCIPCKQMAPIIEALNQELRGKAIIKFVDVWKNPDFAEDYPISIIPTQLLIDSAGNPYQPTDSDSPKMNLYANKDTGDPVFTTHEGTISKDGLLNILKEMGMQ